jgi:3-(3-hydroxy-phenyl)propionate hydroxylase
LSSPSKEFLQAIDLLLKWIPGRDLADLKIQQYETYSSHQLIAREFAVGRVALAGDAAHLTSTNGGMGLNSGVQDAAALSRYLQDAIKNQTTEPLRNYAIEREAFCNDFLQPTTTENHQSVDSSNSDFRLDRLLTLQGQSKDDEATLKVVRRASMLLKV